MSAPRLRKPKPPRKPETLFERLLDLDQRMEGGDALDDVWIEGADWVELVDRAETERDMAGLPPTTTASLVAVDAELSRFDELRLGLAKALGWGPINGADELLHVVRGYVMALDLERERAAQLAEDVRDARLTPEEFDLQERKRMGLPSADDDQAHTGETYCRSCRKWFPSGTHAPHKGKSSAQAELVRS